MRTMDILALNPLVGEEDDKHQAQVEDILDIKQKEERKLDIQPESYLGMKMASRMEWLGKGSLEHSPFPVHFAFEL